MITRALMISLSFFAVSACSLIQPYKFDIPQGNAIEEEKLDQVKVGMTPSQVIFLLGSPAIQDPFNQERWDYVYHLTNKKRQTSKRVVTLLFKQGKLASITDSKP